MSKVLSMHRKSVLNAHGDLHFYGMTSNVAVEATPFAGTHRSALRKMLSKSEQSVVGVQPEWLILVREKVIRFLCNDSLRNSHAGLEAETLFGSQSVERWCRRIGDANKSTCCTTDFECIRSTLTGRIT